MPEPVIIPSRPFWARVLLPFWMLQVAMGGLFAAAGIRLLGPGENGGAAILILMGLLLAAAGVVLTGLTWRIARLRGPAIEMTAEGLLDRRLARQRIPWEALAWKIIFNGRSYSVQLDVAEPARSGLGVYWHQRAAGLVSRMLRQPEFSVVSMGTGLSAHEIGKRMERFRPPTP
jgi:hypothetical protein